MQHNGISSTVLVASLGLQITEHSGLTIEHCMARDCEIILVVPHNGTSGDHMDQPSDTDTTSVERTKLYVYGWLYYSIHRLIWSQPYFTSIYVYT